MLGSGGAAHAGSRAAALTCALSSRGLSCSGVQSGRWFLSLPVSSCGVDFPVQQPRISGPSWLLLRRLASMDPVLRSGFCVGLPLIQENYLSTLVTCWL